jgi:hypothetical protein
MLATKLIAGRERHVKRDITRPVADSTERCAITHSNQRQSRVPKIFPNHSVYTTWLPSAAARQASFTYPYVIVEKGVNGRNPGR